VCHFTLVEKGVLNSSSNGLQESLAGSDPKDYHSINNDFSFGVELGWVCALNNAYTAILLSFVFFKLFRVLFSGFKQPNYLTLANYGLNILLQILGVVVFTSLVTVPYVYDFE
jgi:hypothetical protein